MSDPFGFVINQSMAKPEIVMVDLLKYVTFVLARVIMFLWLVTYPFGPSRAYARNLFYSFFYSPIELIENCGVGASSIRTSVVQPCRGLCCQKNTMVEKHLIIPMCFQKIHVNCYQFEEPIIKPTSWLYINGFTTQGWAWRTSRASSNLMLVRKCSRSQVFYLIHRLWRRLLITSF